MRSWTHGLARPFAVAALGLTLLAAGCGSGGGGGETTVAVPCDDAEFRGQDEELYVTKAVISNAIGSGRAPAAQLPDLRRARKALGDYLATHPPCAEDLLGIAATEQGALDDLDSAIAALESDEDAGPHLSQALGSLQSAQSALIGG